MTVTLRMPQRTAAQSLYAVHWQAKYWDYVVNPITHFTFVCCISFPKHVTRIKIIHRLYPFVVRISNDANQNRLILKQLAPSPSCQIGSWCSKKSQSWYAWILFTFQEIFIALDMLVGFVVQTARQRSLTSNMRPTDGLFASLSGSTLRIPLTSSSSVAIKFGANGVDMDGAIDFTLLQPVVSSFSGTNFLLNYSRSATAQWPAYSLEVSSPVPFPAQTNSTSPPTLPTCTPGMHTSSENHDFSSVRRSFL